jgi:hypothetical protein
MADTSWLMQQYDMQGAILQAGTFKDQSLQIPHGKFVYYKKLRDLDLKPLKGIKSDTSNYLETYGEFKDGKKDGWWVRYFKSGKKCTVQHYKDGLEDGPYEAYNDSTNALFTSGNYIKGFREGEWDMFNPKGDTVEKDMYVHDRVYERRNNMKAFFAAVPPKGFSELIEQNVTRLISSNDVMDLLVEFDITPEGKLINPKVIRGKVSNPGFKEKLIGIIGASPLWGPAKYGDSATPVKDFSAVRIEIKDGIARANLLNYGMAKERYYNLMSK